jgi:excinuclease ABC subunit C
MASPLSDPKHFLATLPAGSGVYRLFNAQQEVVYVGKAKNLRKRVASYFRKHGLTPKIHTMMKAVTRVDVTVTQNESEALLLENNLIKSLKPRFNVVLRDDKSYPYIFIAEAHEFPRLGFHRGAKREKGRYFGPFPSAFAVRDTLNLLQKLFRLRQCEDTFYKNRSRPCLQHQIHRCSAPCVGLIDKTRYAEDVRHALLFLEGKSRTVLQELIEHMEQASNLQRYEQAAFFRDRIATLKRVQEEQFVSKAGGEADVLALAVDADNACINLSSVRGGLHLGDRAFFPKLGAQDSKEEILLAFLSQYYLGEGVSSRKPPGVIYTSEKLKDRSLLEAALSGQAGFSVKVEQPTRGMPGRWLKMAKHNAQDALRRHLASKLSLQGRFEALREALKLEETPQRLECFDVSHMFGEATVASCVVFDQNGPVKSDYRRFNIEGVKPSDDYGAMAQALTRRYRRVKQGEGRLPDVLLIDGGKGQLAVAENVLQELQIDGVTLVGVAKGEERKPGKEQLFMPGEKQPLHLLADSAALHLIQHIRDEAHRFAITGHRQRRAKARQTSILETVPGIGDRRRQALLKNFGGLQELTRAGVQDIAKVPGVSLKMAQRIHDTLHEQE